MFWCEYNVAFLLQNHIKKNKLRCFNAKLIKLCEFLFKYIKETKPLYCLTDFYPGMHFVHVQTTHRT